MADLTQPELDFSRRNERRWIIETTQALRGLTIVEGGRIRGVHPASAKSVLRTMDGFGPTCFASVEAIAERSLLSVREVYRVLRALENAGIVGREKERRTRGQWENNLYVIDYAALRYDDSQAEQSTVCPPTAHRMPTVCPPHAQWADEQENLLNRNTKTAAVFGAAVEGCSIPEAEQPSNEHDRRDACESPQLTRSIDSEPVVEIERVRSNANRIRMAMPSDRVRDENRETIWQIAWLAERFGEPHIVDDLLRRVRRNTIEHYRSYLAGILRHVCRDHGLDWLTLRSRCPPPTAAPSAPGSPDANLRLTTSRQA
jgi:hypothetical protein